MQNDGIIIEKLNRNHILLDFDCGDEEINNYFNERSFNDVETKNAQVYVVIKENQIVGFFSLSMKAVRMKIEGEEKAWPVALLGQLGVDKKFQGKGWGKFLVTNAINIANEISEDIGCVGVIIETYKEELSTFYKKLGFKYVKKNQTKRGSRFTYFYKFETNLNKRK